MHLRYLGLVSWVSSGLTVGRAAVWWQIDEIDGKFFFFFFLPPELPQGSPDHYPLLLLLSAVTCDSFQSHGLQHARFPCPSLTLRACSDSCPLSWWCHPTTSSSVTLFPLLLPSIFASIRVFFNESVLPIRWPKYWSFSISPSSEYPGLISLRIDWFDLLSVQGTLKSLLQHHSSKASILWGSTFFIAQLSHPHMTTEKTIALTRRIFVGKVMSLLFNMLSSLVITFHPRSKCLLISWVQSPSAVILEPPK